MNILKNILVPFKMYYATRWMQAQKKAIRKAREAGDFKAECDALCRATTDWSREILDTFGMNIRIIGRENIPEKGPVAVVANHQGYADTPIIMWTLQGLPLCFVAKKMMGKLPFYGRWVKHWEYCALMDQKNLRQAAQTLKWGRELLQRGYSVVIFPEGHRSKCNTPLSFHAGSFRMMDQVDVPILPISISGSFRVYEEKGFIQPADILVTVHPPRRMTGLDRKGRNSLAKEIEEVICSTL